jgi:membrane-anchored protein YejM (alkaline phosphatase superfamily)
MPEQNILVIAVDGLRAAALGAYGNTAYSTPALDEFAAESLLFDWCFAEAVELPAIYQSLWQSEPSLLTTLASRGYQTTLVTDEPAIGALSDAAGFGDCVLLPSAEARRADDVSETQLAHLFAAASEQLATDTTAPRLVWLHSRGMYGPWDAPLELQEELLAREEGDPPPDDVIAPPALWLAASADPDAAFRWSCAYAAQVMTLDACIEGLLRTIDEIGRGKWHLVLTGLRGFPLGEHDRVGGVDDRLFAEQLHVPLVWRFADGQHRLSRRGGLVSLADLAPATLSIASGELEFSPRSELISAAATGCRSIRTADWSLRQEPAATDENEGGDPRCQLFVRPDDRWEANDVAGLCPDAVELLLARLGASTSS